MDSNSFVLPDDAPPDLAAVADLCRGLQQLAEAVDELHQQHLDLRDQVTARPGGRARKAPPSVPWPLRWADLDREQATQVWAWLIDWTGWLVERYQLAEELPACWPLHAPLIEELAALAAAWHDAYDELAPADAPLLWHERLARCRIRLRDWDDYTRCRNGTHTLRRLDLAWPDTWRIAAEQAAAADLADRPLADPGPDDRAAGSGRDAPAEPQADAPTADEGPTA
jgi:hypothetical protein